MAGANTAVGESRDCSFEAHAIARRTHRRLLLLAQDNSDRLRHVRGRDGLAGMATCALYPSRRAWARSTTSRPNGVSETGISLKFASPSGIPMIVRHMRSPVTTWPTASHHPARTNQI